MMLHEAALALGCRVVKACRDELDRNACAVSWLRGVN